MKIELDKINELCLPYMKRPKRIIGAKVVVLATIRNKAGEVIERGEVCEIVTSHRGYGLKAPGENGEKPREIHRVSHYDVRFLKEPKKMTNGIILHGKEIPVAYVRDIVRCGRCALDPASCRKICLFFCKPSRPWEKPIFNKPE